MLLDHALDCMALSSLTATKRLIQRITEMFFQVIDNDAGIGYLSAFVLYVGKLAFRSGLGKAQAKAFGFKFDIRHAQVSLNF